MKSYDDFIIIEGREIVMQLSFLAELWILFEQVIQDKANSISKILSFIKRGTRHRNLTVKIHSLSLLFKIMDYFIAERSSYAPILYKTITFSLIENHSNMIIREYIM